MYIGRIYYPVLTLGYGRRIGIWTCGCNKNCFHCTSPEFKDIHAGKWLEVDEIMANVGSIVKAADGVTISGGEPFEQPTELRFLIETLLESGLDDILVYSGYTIEELRLLKDADVDYCLTHIAALIDGRYDETLNDKKGIRGSSNQRVHVYKYYGRYAKATSCERKQQCVQLKDRIVFIGIPKE